MTRSLSIRVPLMIFSALVAIVGIYYYFAVFSSIKPISVHADYLAFKTAEALYNDADLVVVAKPGKFNLDNTDVNDEKENGKILEDKKQLLNEIKGKYLKG